MRENFALSNEHIDDINWYKNKTSQAIINTKLTSLNGFTFLILSAKASNNKYYC